MMKDFVFLTLVAASLGHFAFVVGGVRLLLAGISIKTIWPFYVGFTFVLLNGAARIAVQIQEVSGASHELLCGLVLMNLYQLGSMIFLVWGMEKLRTDFLRGNGNGVK